MELVLLKASDWLQWSYRIPLGIPLFLFLDLVEDPGGVIQARSSKLGKKAIKPF